MGVIDASQKLEIVGNGARICTLDRNTGVLWIAGICDRQRVAVLTSDSEISSDVVEFESIPFLQI